VKTTVKRLEEFSFLIIQGYHFVWIRPCFLQTAGKAKHGRQHLTLCVNGSSSKANLPLKKKVDISQGMLKMFTIR
jgi:hypothetical protein